MKKKILISIFFFLLLFTFSNKAFAITSDNQSIIDSAFSAGTSNTGLIAQYNYNKEFTTGIQYIDLKLSSTDTSVPVQITLGCDGCGHTYQSNIVNITSPSTYRFNFQTYGNDIIVTQIYINKTQAGQLTIWGSSTDTTSGYAYYNGTALSPPAPIDFAFAINTNFDWVDSVTVQNAPLQGSINSSLVTFSGGISNASGADEIVLGITNVTLSRSEVYTHAIQPLFGASEVFNFTQQLNKNTEYLYTLQVHNTALNTYSDITAPIGFVTNDSDIKAGFPAPTWATCDVDHLVGCVQNMLTYLFYPQTDVFNQFSLLSGVIKNKPPIGYVYGFITVITDVSATADQNFNIPTSMGLNTSTNPFFTNIFNPIRTGMGWILWIAFAVVMIKRFQHFNL